MNTSHHYHSVPESMTRLARLVVLLLLAILALQLVAVLTPQPVRVVGAAEVAGGSIRPGARAPARQAIGVQYRWPTPGFRGDFQRRGETGFRPN